MASYSETRDSFNEKLKEMVNGLTTEELFWVLSSVGVPQDARKSLINEVAEKLMEGNPTNDELLAIALSPSHLGKDAAKKILDRNPNNAQLFLLMANWDLLGQEISNAAKQISDDRFFAGTDIRERITKAEK